MKTWELKNTELDTVQDLYVMTVERNGNGNISDSILI